MYNDKIHSIRVCTVVQVKSWSCEYFIKMQWQVSLLCFWNIILFFFLYSDKKNKMHFFCIWQFALFTFSIFMKFNNFIILWDLKYELLFKFKKYFGKHKIIQRGCFEITFFLRAANSCFSHFAQSKPFFVVLYYLSFKLITPHWKYEYLFKLTNRQADPSVTRQNSYFVSCFAGQKEKPVEKWK